MSKKNTFYASMRYILRYWPLIIICLVFSISISVITTYTPYLTALVLDTVILDSMTTTEKTVEVTNLLTQFALLTLVSVIFRYAQSITQNITGMKVEKAVREDAIRKIDLLPIDYYSLEPDGKIVAKITSDSRGIRELYFVSFSLVQALINIAVVYTGLLLLEKRLALILLVVVPVILLWITVYRSRVHEQWVKIREYSSRITGKLNELISGAQIIQAFNQERNMLKEYKDLVDEYNTSDRKVNTVSTYFGWELLQIIKRFVEAGILLYFGLVFLGDGVVITAGLVYCYTNYLDKMIQPINTIFDNLNVLEDSLVAADRSILFIAEVNDEVGDAKPDFPLINNGDVEFTNVKFGYEPNTLVLNDLNLNVKSGEVIGIVGHTGSGKSTLMNLLLRYNDYKYGSIKLDGLEISEYNKRSYRKNLGIVLQTPALFEGTLKSNVTLNRECYSDQEVVDVLNLVGAGFIIEKSPLGINQPISFKGDNLSLGEKQLISFARIMLRNPKVLVLDEATANIDSDTELKIKNAMNVITENRTTFIIAHRLSTIKDASKIVVIDGGNIVGLGQHEELLNNCQNYKDMYDAQFKKNK